MSRTALPSSRPPHDPDISPLVVSSAALLSLERWSKELDGTEPQRAVLELTPCVGALKKIETQSVTSVFTSKQTLLDETGYSEALSDVSSLIATLLSFKKFAQNRNSDIVRPATLKPNPTARVRELTRKLVNAIEALGAFFGLSRQQLGTLAVNAHQKNSATKGLPWPKKVRSAYPDRLPNVVNPSPARLDELAAEIRTQLPPSIIHENEDSIDPYAALERSNAQRIIGGCAHSVSLIATSVSGERPEKVDENIVEPAYERACEALVNIKTRAPAALDPVNYDAVNADARSCFSAALTELLLAVADLAYVHYINNKEQIQWPARYPTATKKARAAPKSEQTKPSKRAREESVAKAFNFGRWGGMSARRANIYGLL